MRIAYFLNWEVRWGQGILKKVLGHARAWMDAGCEVRIFMLSPDLQVQGLVSQSNPDIALTVRRHYNIVDRLIQYGPLVDMALAWQPDLVYLRFAGYYSPLARLARNVPTVLEINTDDITEYPLVSWYHDAYNRLTRQYLLSQARGMVFVTNELMAKPYFRCFGKPGIVIANGIALEQYQPLSPPENRHPRLVFIGSVGAPWHGVDKIRLLAQHQPEWSFEIIGSPPEALQGAAPANLHMHGILERMQYEPILAQSDIAIGTLALHRNQMQEASPLKVREYLAFGLPTIIAYDDTDLAQPHPSILQLPNTPDNVSTQMARIQAFVEQAKGTRIPRADIAHIDSRQKELRRLEFFRSLI